MDEIGYLDIQKEFALLFFRLIPKRYEKVQLSLLFIQKSGSIFDKNSNYPFN
jgi:DNA replication protein DnaC